MPARFEFIGDQERRHLKLSPENISMSIFIPGGQGRTELPSRNDFERLGESCLELCTSRPRERAIGDAYELNALCENIDETCSAHRAFAWLRINPNFS